MYLNDAYDVAMPVQVRQQELTSDEQREHFRHQIFREESATHAREGGTSWVPGVDRADVCVLGPGRNHLRQGAHCPHSSTAEEFDSVTVVTL